MAHQIDATDSHTGEPEGGSTPVLRAAQPSPSAPKPAVARPQAPLSTELEVKLEDSLSSTIVAYIVLSVLRIVQGRLKRHQSSEAAALTIIQSTRLRSCLTTFILHGDDHAGIPFGILAAQVRGIGELGFHRRSSL